MKAVIYARYSCSNQREESIEGQIRECQAYADRYGYIVVDTYIDRAKTGRKDTRPAFQKMVADSAKHTFDCVILWKFDRFARGRELSARYKKMLTDNNVKVLSVTEHIPDSPEGILLESVLDGLAEYYSVELAMKVDRGMKQNVLNRKCNGGTLTLGYLVDENRHYILDPVSAPAVLEAFQHYDSGYTMKEIVDEMNQKGIRSSRGSKININMMTKLLHNRRYLGEYKYKDTIVPDGFPRIVSDELFERVQERMKIVQKRSRQSTVEDEYILTTKLYCGECGRTMVGESGTSSGNGMIHRYYKCTGVKKHLGCTKKTVKKDWIEDIVIDQIMKVLFNEELLNQVADEVLKSFDKENTLLPVLYNEKKEIDNGIKNLLDAIQQGIITESTKERLVELETKRKELEKEIAKEEAAKPVITKEHIMCWFGNLKNYNIKNATHLRRLVDVFINAIYLFDDKIILVFNFKDNTKRTKKEEIQKSPSSSALNDCCAPRKASTVVGAFSLLFSKFVLYYVKIINLRWTDFMDISALFNETEKPLENFPANGGFCGILRRIACVGDSLSSGEFEAINENGEKTYHDMFDFSWGQFLARMTGTTVLNFSRGGMTAREYCEGFAEANDFWNPDKKCIAYIIALGVNDISVDNPEVGSIEDIDFENYKNNKPTFAGYYAEIIQRYKEIQPDANFFLMTTPTENCAEKRREAHREILYKMADAFTNCYVLDFAKYAPVYDEDFKKKFFMGGHMNPCGYMLTAQLVASYIDYIIRHNIKDFEQVGFIGTDLKYDE